METDKNITLIAIDYSMSSPAICIYTGKPKDFVWRQCNFYIRDKKGSAKKSHNQISYSKESDWSNDTQRYDATSEWVMNIIEDYDPSKTFMIIEDYAFGAKGRVFGIGENTGILKHKLWLRGYNLGVCAPTKIKKFATGNGCAKKEDMFNSWLEETNLNLLPYFFTPRKTKVDSPVSDIIDAYYLCKLLSTQAQ